MSDEQTEWAQKRAEIVSLRDAGYTLGDIASRFNISRERVRQIWAKAHLEARIRADHPDLYPILKAYGVHPSHAHELLIRGFKITPPD
jgi:orotate phosphoribosyltransferase-like protein